MSFSAGLLFHLKKKAKTYIGSNISKKQSGVDYSLDLFILLLTRSQELKTVINHITRLKYFKKGSSITKNIVSSVALGKLMLLPEYCNSMTADLNVSAINGPVGTGSNPFTKRGKDYNQQIHHSYFPTVLLEKIIS